MIGKTLSHYRIIEKIGEGGMGAVYRAEDTELERDVAFKVLPEDVTSDPVRLERFRREAKTLARLNHPNIVQVHSVEEADGTHFLTMEMVEGKPLSQLIPARGLTSERFFDIAVPLAEALAAAHERKITHRDLKPANIMVTDEDDWVKVLDFGLAKVQAEEGGDEEATLAASLAMTQEGAIVGTVPYMSPEQAMGQAVDQRSDIFSLGIILYEMLTGGRPFQGEDPVSTMSSILRDVPVPVTEVKIELPRHLGRILQRCLEKEPRNRYQTGRDVLNELKGLQKEIASEVAVATGPPPAAPKPVTFSRRTLIAAGLLLALAIGVVASYIAFSGRAGPGAVDSIVALPARVIGSSEDAHLADAIPSNLSTHLAGLEDLETKVPPTEIEMEKLGGDLEKLARLLGVTTFVMTTITAQSSQLVLDIQLVRARGRSVTWSHQYAGHRGAYLELVQEAAEGLRQKLRPDSGSTAGVTTLGATSEAELTFQRGKYASNRFNNHHQPADFEIAREAFEEALALDPGLVKAVEQLAMLHTFQFETVFDPAVLDEIEALARRSLEMDPRSSGGWNNLQYVEMRRRGDPLLQLEYALKAADYGPRKSLAQMSLGIAVSAYSTTLSIEANKEASRLDPLYLYPPLNAAGYLKSMGRAQEALTTVERVLEIEPGQIFALLQKLPILVHLDRLEEAAELHTQLETMVAEGRLPEAMVTTLGNELAIEIALEEGDFAQAASLLDSQRPEEADETLFARRWRKDEAFKLMDSQRELGVTTPLDHLLLSPHLESLRTDSRLEPFVADARVEFEKALALLEKSRAEGNLPRYFEAALDQLVADLGP